LKVSTGSIASNQGTGSRCRVRGAGNHTAVQLFKQQKVFEELDLDFVIYDVLGDVVCGGFAVPIERESPNTYLRCLLRFMAIYAANNLFKGIQKYSNSGGALLGD